MLPKENRLQTNYDFRKVKNHSTVVHTPYFTLLYRVKHKNKDMPPRIGFIASKKFDKRAVTRNRARRLLREVIREHLDDIHSGYDIILIARTKIKDAKYQEVNTSFNKILSKVPFA